MTQTLHPTTTETTATSTDERRTTIRRSSDRVLPADRPNTVSWAPREDQQEGSPAASASTATVPTPAADSSPDSTPASAARVRPGSLAAVGSPAVRPPAAAHLSDEQVAELARELDAVRDEVLSRRGASDAAYIRRVIRLQRVLELAGRGCLLNAQNKVAWVAGTAMLTFAKIIENMEIGHNVLHGQWDWMRDPDIHSTTWEWDFVTPSTAWQNTHNDLHHRWTNVIGKDRDVGYNVLRMDEDEQWQPRHILNPVINAGLAPVFEWGIALYDLELDRVKAGEKSREELMRDLRSVGVKAAKQFAKDYAATPVAAELLTGSGKAALIGTVVANGLRNIWAHSVIFCGHFPEGAETFTEEMVEGETRGDWYVRQMIGSANIDGSKFMHFMTGNLSHQVEHHLFPDLPSNRYAEVAPQVREICARYGLPYTTGPLLKQVGSAWAKVFRLALPGK
ncbi:fatty acid desaturase family protein [Micrococcus terreus]|uniref:fatty acid desaturase family protein n=1 Tax=Micrococcus terreus TaxID=574650 RepID=UPI00254B6950|nr:fatty acid desaturase [Micrococcus terreus]MDK7702267.1 fatty acid desaturase [Micrococcus terreus]WOO98835.1 fatty acid desaturase [Micrococcus terreus]